MEERPAEARKEHTAASAPGEPAEFTRNISAARDTGSGWVNTDVAAAALDVSPRTVRDYIAAGRLAARIEGSGVQKRYSVSIESLQDLLDRRRREAASSPRNRRDDVGTMSAAFAAARGAEGSAAEAIRELVIRLEARTAEAADARARLELTERAESTLREELERERRQRIGDVQRERMERLEAQQKAEQLRRDAEEARARAERLDADRDEAAEEARSLREELEAERSKGFWRRLFGG